MCVLFFIRFDVHLHVVYVNSNRQGR